MEVEGVSVGLGQLYARLLGHVEEALAGDSAPCDLQVVIVFFATFQGIVALVGATQVVKDSVVTSLRLTR